jgi:hypothetical protein
MPTRMSGARQLLKALESPHNAGIVHHGELTLFPYFSVHANYSVDLNDENVSVCEASTPSTTFEI